MEESKSDLKVVNFLPKELLFNREHVRGTRLSMDSNQYVNVRPQGGLGAIGQGGSYTFDAPITSTSLVDAVVNVRADIAVVYTIPGVGNLADALDAVADNVGFQAFPLNRCFTNCNIKLNSLTINSNPSELVTPLLYSMSKDELRRMSTLAIPDHEYSYNAASNGSVIRSQPNAAYYSRGFGSVRIVNSAWNNGATQLTVTYRHSERLLARGTGFAEMNPPALIGINSFIATLNMSSDFTNNVVARTGAGITAATCSLSNMELVLRQFRPHANMAAGIPTVAYYNVPQFDDQLSGSVNIAAGATEQNMETGTRTFTTVPKMYCIFASSPASATQPERLYPLTNVSIEQGNKRNLLRNYSQEELYEISVQNGYNGTASQFFSGQDGAGLANGCMLIVKPSDWDSDLFFQSNAQVNHNFRVQASVHNPSGAQADNVRLHCVAVTDNFLEYRDGAYFERAASLSSGEIEGAADMFIDHDLQQDRVMGGSVWGWIKKAVRSPLFKSVTRFARNNIPILDKYAGDNTAIGKFAKKHGYGNKGGGIVNLGGQKVTKQDLMKML